MFRRLIVLTGLLVLTAPFRANGQIPAPPAPTKEHVWLDQFEGEWEGKSESIAAPGQPSMTCNGVMKSSKFGNYWITNELSNDMMGTKIKGIQTIGFDVNKKKYVGTWIDDMLTHMWKYEGEVDASGKKLVLEAEGPDMLKPGKTALYRDSYEFKSKDHIIATSEIQGEDGKWTVFMKGDMKRKK